MKVLCTFPGRCGDIFWALPSMRALSETLGEPVDLQIAGEFESLLPLLRMQLYLGHVCANPSWGLSTADSWQAPDPVGTPPGTYDHVFHLGYRRWPELPLPLETFHNLVEGWLQATGTPLGASLDLQQPWITIQATNAWPQHCIAGWSDCWFELKYGLMGLLLDGERDVRGAPKVVLCPAGSRWETEAGYYSTSWVDAATFLNVSKVFFGDCSALHVLAVAMGKPAVLCEPMEARWNDIFYPVGKVGPQVRLVTGLDGRPTFDSRHCAEAIQEVLRGC